MKTSPRLAGLELGGTKSIALIASGQTILDQVSIPTTAPDETLRRLNAQLLAWQDEAPIEAIGIASFGPVQLDRRAPRYGTMLTTPKPGWTGAPVADRLTQGLDCPWIMDTDVNGAALAEYRWGAGQGCDSFCYVTIGTGLGGGLIVDGKPVHGIMHPEMGHIRLKRAAIDTFAGVCPFHGDCIEGLVSGPALAARFGVPASSVADDHPVWDHVVSDLAEFAGALLLTTAARRILFGGGVSGARPFLLDRVGDLLVERLGSYLPFLNEASVRDIIRAPALGDKAGPRGALALAENALTVTG